MSGWPCPRCGCWVTGTGTQTVLLCVVCIVIARFQQEREVASGG